MNFDWFRGISKKEELTPERYNKTWYRFEKFWNDHDSGVDKWTMTNTGGIVGISDGSSAAAGNVGELIDSSVSSATNTGANGVWANITTISLTAGDWDVSGSVEFAINGSTITAVAAAISLFSGNTTTDQASGKNSVNGLPPISTADCVNSIPRFRVSISATTTVYLKGVAIFSAGQPQFYGYISARRVR